MHLPLSFSASVVKVEKDNVLRITVKNQDQKNLKINIAAFKEIQWRIWEVQPNEKGGERVRMKMNFGRRISSPKPGPLAVNNEIESLLEQVNSVVPLEPGKTYSVDIPIKPIFGSLEINHEPSRYRISGMAEKIAFFEDVPLSAESITLYKTSFLTKFVEIATADLK